MKIELTEEQWEQAIADYIVKEGMAEEVRDIKFFDPYSDKYNESSIEDFEIHINNSPESNRVIA